MCHQQPSEAGAANSCNSSATREIITSLAINKLRFYSSRDGISLFPLSVGTPSGHACRALCLARWFAGTPPMCHPRPSEPDHAHSCNSSAVPIAILGHFRAQRLARWNQFVSIERRYTVQTRLQGTMPRSMICQNSTNVPPTAFRARSHPLVKFIWHPKNIHVAGNR